MRKEFISNVLFSQNCCEMSPYGLLTKEQFDAEIEKGMADIRSGRVYSADDVEAEMKRDFGI